MLSTRDIAGMLKENGVLPTQQRLMIARVLFERHQHLSADQVMARVNTGRDHVSKATIYNTLGLFARKGLVREVIVDYIRPQMEERAGGRCWRSAKIQESITWSRTRWIHL